MDTLPDYGVRWNIAQDLKAVLFQKARERSLFLYDLGVYANEDGTVGVNLIRGVLDGETVHEVGGTQRWISVAFDWERKADTAYLAALAVSVLDNYEAG